MNTLLLQTKTNGAKNIQSYQLIGAYRQNLLREFGLSASLEWVGTWNGVCVHDRRP